ncbi:deoxyribose-phosphate aldolase [Mesomycoplasma ovipneumoniae]|uniref:Deoxyribose-phosphate aldolase n=1 Tax=Mesomycoplasma ovipneumoniae TaxID=29562 RepID=A0AAP5Y240_9BACT|nr:deoxyribose-phosphate aldolase [Mesomycoplasma ovipneumoniae]MDW2907823.1 deoxyribose-phosphate aldolase [Mesomycoplasma ovipneumoniae]MDW2909878.1 deoxyribose-phosphate aldolase [Mesomycoplasma ovipneumoniae]MDW2911628.1 deoxyribose-phosphate aldolase [Mesomycoplasma ovipneumoniae]MDW2912244.1 deoxyribose-phosphate aldolase [Mesomycoplasma ovipneumoniae]MDW2912883.1 deoxyribose-phosphate aldolase [Mesomycoplasma ovipneumoniae]
MNFNKLIDHTILKAQTTSQDIKNLIAEAKKYNFGAICIAPAWVKLAKQELKDTDIKIVTVIGFPLGNQVSAVKQKEASLAIMHGADEIDMVMNIGKFKEKEFDFVINEINLIKKEIGTKILKVIVETALLSANEIAEATKIVSKSNADFIKTSTGFSYRGASLQDIEIMSANKSKNLQIKAAGGISSIEDIKTYYKLGATRFGTSKSVSIVENLDDKKSEY